jgi:hypothetical protein
MEALQKRAWGVNGHGQSHGAVAHVGTKRVGDVGMWRAEVGPMLPGDCP